MSFLFVLIIFLMMAASADDWPTRVAVFLFFSFGAACAVFLT